MILCNFCKEVAKYNTCEVKEFYAVKQKDSENVDYKKLDTFDDNDNIFYCAKHAADEGLI